MNFKRSKHLYEEALNVIIGGVNSPSRSFRAVGDGTPVFIKKAEGAHFWDEDNNTYIDYLGAFGPIILGHAHPEITRAIIQAAENGVLYGTPTEKEIQFAKMLQDLIPSMERIRFVNSGTEAVMTTIRLARAYTKKDKILKFAGCYHGHADPVLVQAGSGPSTLGIPDSAGIPKSIAQEVITVPFNDIHSLEEAFSYWGDQLAGVLVEPLVGNFGIVPPKPGFLEKIKELATKNETLVIYDEVITGFRFHYGAVQTLLNVEPDLTALGKIIGGGLPIGAYGGKEKIMEKVAPMGPMYQAGTMAGNPLSISAGIACIQALSANGIYKDLKEKATRLTNAIQDLAKTYSLPVVINQQGGAFTVYFSQKPITNYAEAQKADDHLFSQFFRYMLNEGVYLAPSKYEAWFLTTAHSLEDINYTINAVEKSFSKIKK